MCVQADFNLPVAGIHRLERVGKKKSGTSGYFLDITCKDLRVMRFQWPQRDSVRKKLVSTLNGLAFPGDQKSLFAFYYRYQEGMIISCEGGVDDVG